MGRNRYPDTNKLHYGKSLSSEKSIQEVIKSREENVYKIEENPEIKEGIK